MRRKPRRRITSDLISISTKLLAGTSPEAVAKEEGMTRGTLEKHLVRAGFEMVGARRLQRISDGKYLDQLPPDEVPTLTAETAA